MEVNCDMCGEPMGDEVSLSKPTVMHRECGLRAVMGGIGHHLDHAHFCKSLGDPDAGLNYRTSALLVDTYYARLGRTRDLGDDH